MDSESAEIIESVVDVDTEDGPMAVLLKRPANGDHPAVVFFHDGPGMRAATHDCSRRLAGEGYVVAVPDLYHRHGRMIGFMPEDVAADPDSMKTIWAMIKSITDDGIQADLDGALEVLGDAATERMGCIGFCLGARAVYRTMSRRPDRFVSGAMWHPSFLVDDESDSPHLAAAQLSGSLYMGLGEIDEVMPVSLMQPFLDEVATREDTTIIDIHADADHGYTWPGAPSYNEAAAETSWTKTLAMFADSLGD